jgi:hypothetical protein
MEVTLSHLFSAVIVGGGVVIVVTSSNISGRVLGVVVVAMFSVIWLSVFRGARSYICLNQGGFAYFKSLSNAIRVKACDVNTFFAPAVGGNIVIDVKYRPKRVLVPIIFQNINLLNFFLTKWRLDNMRK